MEFSRKLGSSGFLSLRLSWFSGHAQHLGVGCSPSRVVNFMHSCGVLGFEGGCSCNGWQGSPDEGRGWKLLHVKCKAVRNIGFRLTAGRTLKHDCLEELLDY